MTRDIFVIAGSRHQFENLLVQAQAIWKDEIKTKQVHEVDHPDMIRTIDPGARLFVYGSFQKRIDFPMLQREIARRGLRTLIIQ